LMELENARKMITTSSSDYVQSPAATLNGKDDTSFRPMDSSCSMTVEGDASSAPSGSKKVNGNTFTQHV